MKIPDNVKEGSAPMKISFLKGLFDSDGNIYKKNGKNVIQLRQKSYEFLKEVQKLFNDMGIIFHDPYFDRANNSSVLLSSKKELVDNFINKVIEFKLYDLPG